MKNLSKIILATSNYNNVKKGNTLSVTGDDGNAWGYFGASYKKLAPKLSTFLPYKEGLEKLSNIKNIEEYKELRKEIEDKYIKSYYDTRLKNLNVKELLYILKEKYGENIILMCHEEINEFCHRRLIADYIELETGIYIPEITMENNKVKKLIPIRYKKRLLDVINKNRRNYV